MRSKQRNSRAPHQGQNLLDRRHNILPVDHLGHSSFLADDHSTLLVAVATDSAVLAEGHMRRLDSVETILRDKVDRNLDWADGMAHRWCRVAVGL